MPLVIEEVVGPLFERTDADGASVAHSVACDLVMNRGIARQFKRRGVDAVSLQHAPRWPGRVLDVPFASRGTGPRYAFYLVTETRRTMQPNATRASLAFMQALCALADRVAFHRIRRLAIPRFAGGFGPAMVWGRVKSLLMAAFHGMDLHISVYRSI